MPLSQPLSADATEPRRRGPARLTWALPTEAVVLMASQLA
jgi:hypothetical protein